MGVVAGASAGTRGGGAEREAGAGSAWERRQSRGALGSRGWGGRRAQGGRGRTYTAGYTRAGVVGARVGARGMITHASGYSRQVIRITFRLYLAGCRPTTVGSIFNTPKY